MREWIKPVGIVAALIFLNTSLSFHNVWPTPWITVRPEISVEAAVILLCICVYSAAFASSVGPKTRYLVATLLLLLVIGRYVDVTAPSLFGRPVYLYWDVQHVPRVVAMILDSAGRSFVFGVLLLIVVTIIGLLFGLSQILRLLWEASQNPKLRFLLSSLSLSILGLYVVGMASRDINTERWFSIPVSYMYTRQLSFTYDAFSKQIPVDLPVPSVVIESDLAQLKSRDTYLFFLESYGATVLGKEGFIKSLNPAVEVLLESADTYGWHIATALYESPTFGGASWLAHATLMTGIWIDRQEKYQALMTTERPNLATYFRDAGYRTVALMPGLKMLWPEGAFYGYDKIWNADQLKYTGPEFGWWRIPDQYSLAHFYDVEGTDSSRNPLFVFFATISSHMPFAPIPPYQENWDRILSYNPYDEKLLPLGTGPSVNPKTARLAYEKAIDYELRLLAGFLRKTAFQKPVIIVLGDHQPPALVSGRGASWLVPVHVFARDEATIEPFFQAGFARGFEPTGLTLGRLNGLHELILKGFDSSWRAQADEK
ncbi:MAG: hypothetical protein CMM34_04820 [Rhodospirillaceae bacterium]|nr:hypothetical protein [Rhodospirillaceae bacterium]